MHQTLLRQNPENFLEVMPPEGLAAGERELLRVLKLQMSYHLFALEPREHFGFHSVPVHLQRSGCSKRVIVDRECPEIGVPHF